MSRSRPATDVRIRRRSLLLDGLSTFVFLLIIPPVVSLVPVPVVGGLTVGYLLAGGLAGYFIGRVGVVLPVLAVTTTVHVALALLSVGIAPGEDASAASGVGELLLVLWVAAFLAGLVGLLAGAKLGPEW